LLEVADRFKEMPNGVAKSTLAMQLFGKSGADMIPLLNGGSEAIKEFNGHMDKTTSDAAERFNDSFTRVGISIDGAKAKLLTSMVPSIDTLSGRIENLSDWITNNSDEIERFADRAMNDFTALSQVGGQAFGLIGETSTVMANIVSGAFGFMADEVLGSDDAMIENFGFFEYFILGLSAATSGIGQFVANAKMAYATVSETHAKYGSISGLITNGGYDAAKARMDYNAASLEAQKYDKNVIDTYDTLVGLKSKLKNTNPSSEKQTFTPFQLEDFDKQKTGKSPKLTQAEKDAKELAAIEQRMFDERMNDGIKRFQNDISAKEKAGQDYIKSSESMYSAINEASGNWYDNEIVNISNRAAEFAAAGNDVIDIERYVSASMLSIDEKRAKEQADLAKKTFEEQNKFWIDLMGNINKAMDDQFFNAMTGKFESFGSWLKNFWGAMTNSLARGLSKSLADAMIDTGAGGIQNIFKSFGGLGSVFGSVATPAALIGATTDSAGFTTTVGGTVMDAAGQITKSGSDASAVMDAINIASTANTAYSALTGGLSSSIASGFANGGAVFSQTLENMGLISAETSGTMMGGIGSFGAGVASPFAGFGAGGAAGWGSLVGGAAIGGIGGYALGSLGDSLLGADTKAANYGAIGGATGAIVGSVVPVIGTAIGAVVGAALGSVIGGMFGSTKVKGSGYYFNSATEDGSNAQTYVDYKKKSWFSSSSWTTYTGVSDVEKLKIKGMFDTYDYLFSQLGSSSVVSLAAGKYSGISFQDALAKDFISKYTGLDQKIVSAFQVSTTNPEFTKIYSYWTDYAKTINKTVAEALTSSVGMYVAESRTFSEWKFGSGTTEQLKFTADYLTKDLAALENQMGVSGITVENYLSKYEEAMKSSFTPETILSWKNLGEALMSATDANTKYTDSIKALSTYTKPSDMMLSRVGDATSITGQNNGIVNTAMLDVLQKMWKEMQTQTTIAQLNRGTA